VLAKTETKLDGINAKKLSDEALALLAELRESNTELKKTLANPALQKLPDDTAAAVARIRAIVDDPNLPKSIASLSRSLARIDRIWAAAKPTSRSRSRTFGRSPTTCAI
jgi:hypothetical protein